jgi:intein-encoded DNA endonuclease-like protein
MEIGQSAGKSYAYLLGVYLGDGCVTTSDGRLAFRLNTIDQDFAEAVKTALEELTDYSVSLSCHAVKKSSKPNWSLSCRDPALCERLQAHTGSKASLPDVFNWDRPLQKAFVVGLMDSEGYVAEKTEHKTGRAYYMGFKSCDVWVPDFVRLLQSMGVKLGKVSVCPPYREHYKTPTRFHIKMQSWVDSGMRFNIKRKQDRVDRWAASEPYTERSRFPRKRSSETA